jgi:hypothetical protein
VDGLPAVSKKQTPAGGQALVEYVLLFGLLSAAVGVTAALLKGAVAVVGGRFLAGLAALP